MKKKNKSRSCTIVVPTFDDFEEDLVSQVVKEVLSED
jgi:hypothetical protein